MADEPTDAELEEILADLDFYVEMEEATTLETEEEALTEEVQSDEPQK